MTYREALRYLETTAMFGGRLGLARVKELLEKLGSPETKLRFIHIAGTNGKGSTAAMLASILQRAGYRTGLFTSPHLLRYNERFRIDGAMISNARLAEVTDRVRLAAETMEETPTQFELLTCIALCYFYEERCDIVVLEVGLGGRLDATNVIPASEVGAITRIGLEHTEILGSTLAEIAGEKAGIVKAGMTVVLGDRTPEVRRTVQAACDRVGARLVEADPARPISATLRGQRFAWRQYADLFLPLLGEHQLQNAGTVLEVVEQLRRRGCTIPDAAVKDGLEGVFWPGRLECVSVHPAFLIDGGHNPQCAQAIAAALRAYFPGRKVLFLVGVLSDKNFRGIFDALIPLAGEVAAVTPNSPRALPAKTLCARLRQEYGFSNATPYERVSDALEHVRQAARPDDVACACGSLYLIGEVRELLHLRETAPDDFSQTEIGMPGEHSGETR